MTDAFSAKWLENLSPDAIEAFRSVCKTVSLDNGDAVYRIGAKQDSIWGVASGQVRVHAATNEMDPVLGHIHTPGAWMGELEFVLAQPAYVAIHAAGPTRLFRIDGRTFRDFGRQYPEIWESLARLASLNLWLATSAANDLALRTARKRIAAVVLRLSGNRAAVQGNIPVESIYASQQEIADLANVARTTAWKILKDFQKNNLIKLDYARISVLSVDGLNAVLND